MLQGIIVFALFLLHFIDHFFRRDLTLIFMQFWNTVENELWLLRDNFVGECLRNQISLWQFDTQKPAFHLQLKSPWTWVASARIVWFQQLGSAFIITVYPVLGLPQVTLARTHCGGPCTSLSQFWHPLLSKALLSWTESVVSEWNR